MPNTLTIDRRFCGPPASSNGGYVCGLIAKQLNGLVEVRLSVPPPLNTTMLVSKDNAGGAKLLLDGELIATAKATTWSLEVPAAPSLNTAEEAEKSYAGFEHHALPTCFVCGPKRAQGDGLRIFAGSIDDASSPPVYASRWQVHSSLGDNDGLLRSEFIWAALDCPGYFAVKEKAGFALLGSFSVDLEQDVSVGQTLVVCAWPITSSGRKHIAGSALFNNQGALLAKAIATWISVPEDAYVAATT